MFLNDDEGTMISVSIVGRGVSPSMVYYYDSIISTLELYIFQ